MVTRSERGSSGRNLKSAKRWIGLATVARIAVIWAEGPVAKFNEAGIETEKADSHTVAGFIVPIDSKGSSATPISQKVSMRASL